MTQAETYTHPTRGTSWHTDLRCPRCGGVVATNGRVRWCTACHQPSVFCDVYSRIVGYLRPVSAWAKHKQDEFYRDRVTYQMPAVAQLEEMRATAP